jgi:hypothetical protein
MLAVPPCVDGPSVKMSKQGGVWDDMKRTISWVTESLPPGQAMEVQAQFEAVEGSSQDPKFPVLVRCEYPDVFSAVEIITDYPEERSHPIELVVHESGRVLHRKI